MITNIKYRNIEEIIINDQPLVSIISSHLLWINSNGKQGNRAILDSCNLQYVRLSNVNLSGASFIGANLEMAVLIGAILDNVDLSFANLENAYLEMASLNNAKLNGANFKKINLNHASLQNSNIKNVDLRYSTLLETNFSGSTLTGVRLFGSQRTDWKLSDIECDYVFMDRNGKEQLPNDKRKFRKGDFEKFFTDWPSIEQTFEKGLKPLDAFLLEYVSHKLLDNDRGSDDKYDFFISYASEDRNEIVKPLASALMSKGLSIWYDDFVLKIGDSLRRSIDKGLSSSKYGIVVLSSDFFSKEWPQYELDSLVAKEIKGGKVVLPIWHKVTKDEVLNYSPKLADKVALNSSILSITEIADRLAELFDR